MFGTHHKFVLKYYYIMFGICFVFNKKLNPSIGLGLCAFAYNLKIETQRTKNEERRTQENFRRLPQISSLNTGVVLCPIATMLFCFVARHPAQPPSHRANYSSTAIVPSDTKACRPLYCLTILLCSRCACLLLPPG